MSNELAQIHLPALATLANEAHAKCEAAGQSMMQYAVETAAVLVEAKSRCRHGEWVSWVEDHCDFSERTAQEYVRRAKNLAALPEAKAQHAALLPMRGVDRVLRQEKQVQKREDQLERQKNVMEPELLPAPDGDRRWRVLRNEDDRRWGLQFSPNEAGMKLMEHFCEAFEEPRRVAEQDRIDDLNDRAAELRAEADRLEADAKDAGERRAQQVRQEVCERYGPAYAFTETIEYEAESVERDDELKALDSEGVKAELLAGRGVVQRDYSAKGDMGTLGASKRLPHFNQSTGWARVGYEIEYTPE